MRVCGHPLCSFYTRGPGRDGVRMVGSARKQIAQIRIGRQYASEQGVAPDACERGIFRASLLRFLLGRFVQRSWRAGELGRCTAYSSTSTMIDHHSISSAHSRVPTHLRRCPPLRILVEKICANAAIRVHLVPVARKQHSHDGLI